MANQWAYNQAFADLGNFISNLMLRDQERKRQEEERQKRNSQIQGVLEQLNKGGQYQVGDQFTIGDQLSNPLTQEKFNLQNIVPQKATGLRAGLGDIPKESMQTEPPSPTFKDMLFNSGKTKGVESKYEGRGSSFKEYTPQEKIALAMQLIQIPGGSEALDNYAQMQKMFQPEKNKYSHVQVTDKGAYGYNERTGTFEPIKGGDSLKKKPEQKNTVKVGDKLYAEDPNIKGLPTGDPLFQYPEQKIEYKDKKIYDEQLGKYKVFTEEYVDGKLKHRSQPTYVDTKTVKHGITYMSDELKKDLNKYHKEVNELYSKKKMVEQVGERDGQDFIIKEAKDNGEIVEVKSSAIANDIAKKRAEQISFIKRTASPEFKTWYDKVFNAYDKNDPQSLEEFTQAFMDAYKNNVFKKTIKIKNKKTGEERTTIDWGAEAFDYFRELSRAIYSRYPDATMLQNPEDEEYEVIVGEK